MTPPTIRQLAQTEKPLVLPIVGIDRWRKIEQEFGQQ